MKKDFDDCLALIKTSKIRNFVKKVLKKAPKNFWFFPSSMGRHHPPEDKLEGGVIIHSRKAVQVAVSLFYFFDIQDSLSQDKIIAACILHDIDKDGTPWSENHKHGLAASEWLAKLAVRKNGLDLDIDTDLKEIIEIVKNHMRIIDRVLLTPALKIGEKFPKKDINLLIVQLADYWASRDWCSFVCDEILIEK